MFYGVTQKMTLHDDIEALITLVGSRSAKEVDWARMIVCARTDAARQLVVTLFEKRLGDAGSCTERSRGFRRVPRE